MYLNLSLLTVEMVSPCINNETLVGKWGAGMKGLSLGNLLRKTEGSDSNSPHQSRS